MKLRTLIALALVSAMNLPASAGLIATPQRAALDISAAIPNPSDTLSTKIIGKKTISKPLEQEEISTVAWFDRFSARAGHDLGARTELRIDLDSFDMEYVLRVR